VTQAATWLGLAALGWLVLFQLLLALGLPLGHMAWGGAHSVLSTPRRIASLVSAGLVLVLALAFGQAGGALPALFPASIFPGVIWAGLSLFALSLLGNAVSKSRAERRHGVPLSLIIVGCFLTVALA
jgi:hypothetical protein